MLNNLVPTFQSVGEILRSLYCAVEVVLNYFVHSGEILEAAGLYFPHFQFFFYVFLLLFLN